MKLSRIKLLILQLRKRCANFKLAYLRQIIAAVTTLIAISFAALLWTLKQHSTPFTMKAALSKVLFTVNESPQAERYLRISDTHNLRIIENFDVTEITRPHSVKAKKPPFSATVMSGVVSVSEISLIKNQSYVITSFPGEGISLSIKQKSRSNSSFSALVSQGSSLKITDSAGVSSDFTGANSAIPRSILFSSNREGLPITFRMSPKESDKDCASDDKLPHAIPNVTNLVISEIGLAEESWVLNSRPNSSIIKGELEFPLVERTLKLSSFQNFHLGFTRANLKYLKILPCYIEIELSGIAYKVEAFTSGKSIDLRPSYLELLVKERSLSLFFSSLAAIWAFLWGVKELLFKGDNGR